MPTPSERMLREGFFEFKKNAGEGLCWVRNCRNYNMGDRCLCSKHNMQRWRHRKRCPAAYHTLRGHAKTRKIEFTITPDYFAGLADAFCFFEPCEEEHLTIDRIDPTKGYVPGNLRVISHSLNVAKGNRERYLPEVVQAMLERQRAEAREELDEYLEDEDDCPF